MMSFDFMSHLIPYGGDYWSHTEQRLIARGGSRSVGFDTGGRCRYPFQTLDLHSWWYREYRSTEDSVQSFNRLDRYDYAGCST